jgi:methylenetetrahydrofolate dehydrogenase (NADP+)/methenyltetrahydrofolate cyclohydrolase
MTDGPLILDGREVSRETRGGLARQAAEFTSRYGRKPGLAVIIVGDDTASQIYVRQKAKACSDVGFHSRVDTLPVDTSQESLLARIAALNAGDSFDGILVQLPLPPHISEEAVIEAISPAKDVDGFHPVNVGNLLLDKPGFVPCTPLGIMTICCCERTRRSPSAIPVRPPWRNTRAGLTLSSPPLGKGAC